MIKSTMEIKSAHDEVISFSPESFSVAIVRWGWNGQVDAKEGGSYHRGPALLRRALEDAGIS